MVKKSKKNPESKKTKDDPTWQQIAEANKPLSQKAIELLDDPTKHLISPKEEVVIHREIKIKTQPNPTHTIVTELSPPRRIDLAESQPLKKILKSEIIHRQTRDLTPEEIEALRGELQKTADNPEEDEDDPLKFVKETVKKVVNIFKKKKPAS